MKYLKKYDAFSETIAINPSDSETVKKSKMSVNENEIYLRNYNANKEKLRQIWTEIIKDGEKTVFRYAGDKLLIESEKLITTTLPGVGKAKNPYLSELSNILNIERQIIASQIKISDDSILQTETKNKMQGEESAENKATFSEKVDEIGKRITDNTNKIKVLKDEMDKKKVDFKKRMDGIDRDLQISIKTLKSQIT